MYFVISVNTRTNSGRIVGHATDLESAIAAVKRCAREYVFAKSEPLMHCRDDTDKNTIAPVRFFSSDSTSNIHQIDVFRQRTDSVKGWLGTTQQSHPSELIRRFMYCHYQLAEEPEPVVVQVIAQPPPAPPAPPVAKVRAVAPKVLPTGGFPLDIIGALVDSEQFRKHRKNTDDNVYRRYGVTTLPESEDDE